MPPILLILLLPPPRPPQKPLRQRPIKRRHQRGPQHDHRNRGANRPKEPLPALHIPQIACVHTQITRHERQRQEDDGDDREDDNSFIIRFGLQRDGLRGEEAGGFGLGAEFVEVVDALRRRFENAVEDGDGEGGDAVGERDGGFELAQGGVLLYQGAFDYIQFFAQQFDVVVDLYVVSV